MATVRFVPPTVARVLRLPHRAARGLLLRDMDAWLRVEFLGVAASSGLARALAGAHTPAELGDEIGATDNELLTAFLDLGVALGEVRKRDRRYQAAGRRLKAVADAEGGADLGGTVQEATLFSSAIYRGLVRHLRGAAQEDYFAGGDEVIAQSSRLAEAVLGPLIERVVRRVRPTSVLDIGCGSGVYLEFAARAVVDARVLGVDIAADAVALALSRIAAAGLADRCTARQADLFALPADLNGPHDVVLLLQNVYYWPPHERGRVFSRLRELAPTGTAVVASAVPSGLAFSRSLDLALRVSTGTTRLPTRDELRVGLLYAGFSQVEVVEPLPTTGLVAAIAS